MQEAVTAAYLREQAEKCVRLANSINDDQAAAALRNMAMAYEIRARRLDEDTPLNGVERPTLEPPRP